MICPSCGSANADDVLTCLNCGEELLPNSERVGGRVCQECRFENDIDAKFCMMCGASISTRSKPKAQSQSRHTHEPPRKSKHHTYKRKAWYESPATLVAIALGVVVVFVLYGTTRHQSEVSASIASSGVPLDPATRPAFDKVVDRFICGCGECTEPLWQCNCPTAEKEKNMVKDDLESGVKPPKIVDAVYSSYGHLASGSGSKKSSAPGAGYDPQSLTLQK